MINLPKEDIVELLSLIDGVVFVGGTSEYLQGVKDNLKDIDIVAPVNTDFTDFGHVFRTYKYECIFLSTDRGVIITKQCYIDIFFTDEKINTVIAKGYKCQTIKDMIKIQKGVLEFKHYRGEIQRVKAVTTLNRLINHL